MSNNKSYMNKKNLIQENFFDKLKSFLSKKKGKEKISLLNKIKLSLKVADLNNSVSKFEKSLKKQLGKDYPNLPRYKPEDFLR